jgi:hypothetical protein
LKEQSFFAKVHPLKINFHSASARQRRQYEDYYDPTCGAGWFRNGNNCYRVHTNTAPWRLAKQTCQNADPTADLLWITTKEEEAFIKGELIISF